MKIGLLGLVFNAGNKGCQALSYSFLEILDQIAAKNDEIYDISILMTFPTRVFIKQKLNYQKCMNSFAPQKEY